MTWSKHRIKSQEDLINMIRTFKQLKPEYGSYDTETNGLHIIKCTPFLLAFGFVNVEHKQGHTYTLLLKENPQLTRTTIYALIKLFKKLKKVVGHNVKFDMHMMTNIGYPEIFSENSTDSMIYIRLAHDALSKKEGGIPDALKDYAQQYITPNAKDHEKLIKAEISRRESLRTIKKALRSWWHGWTKRKQEKR